MNNIITFKKLGMKDIAILYKWLMSPHVSKWWYHSKKSFSEIKEKYGQRIKGAKPTHCFLICYNTKPIGHIQMYKINDYPAYKQMIQISGNIAGIDLFIGEKEYLNKGLGKIAVRKFLHELVFPKLSVKSCIVSPNPSNISAIKFYEKLGFKYIKTIFNPDEREEEYLMQYFANQCNPMEGQMEIIVKKPTAEEVQKMKQEPIWEKEVSTFPWYYDDQETCLILEGEVTIKTKSGTVSFKAGDLVIFPKGLDCIWDINLSSLKN